MNLIILKGNLTKDPEEKVTQSGKRVCSATIAVNRKVRQEVDYFRLTAWEKTAELILRYWHKGMPILVRGEMQSRTYTNKQGEERTGWEVLVEGVEFCSGKEDVAPAPAQDTPTQVVKPQPHYDALGGDEDLPF